MTATKNELETQLDECNIWLYKILNKIADIKLDLWEEKLSLEDKALKNELLVRDEETEI